MIKQQTTFQKFLLGNHEEEAIHGYCNEFIRAKAYGNEWFRINQDPTDRDNNIYSYVYLRLEESGFLNPGLLASTPGKFSTKTNRLVCVIKRFLEPLAKGKEERGTGTPGPNGKMLRGTRKRTTEGIILDFEHRNRKP